MFEEIDEKPGFVRSAPVILQYAFQLFCSYPAAAVVGAPLTLLLSMLGLSGGPRGQHFAGYQALACLFGGAVVGWCVGRFAPQLAPTGRWIWLLPAIVVLPDIVREELRRQPVPRLPEYFFSTGSNEGGAVFFLTLPACSAIGYSIGMSLVGVSRTWARLNRASAAVLASFLALACVALLALSASLLHKFEHAKLERLRNVRVVIDWSGLAFSTDPDLVCAHPADGRLPLVKLGDVESLESRVCSGGQLLDVGAPRARDSFLIDRVKVLDGPHAGLEGWVPSYGLSGTVRP